MDFEMSFVVFPEDANSLTPLIFGGAFFSKMDLCASRCVNRKLYQSENCDTAVTHKFSGTFQKPCYLGDLIFLNAEIVEIRDKSIAVRVVASRETKDPEQLFKREVVAFADFVFVSVACTSRLKTEGPTVYEESLEEMVKKRPDKLPYAHHGLQRFSL
jgi:acyl-CoA hydrolase